MKARTRARYADDMENRLETQEGGGPVTPEGAPESPMFEQNIANVASIFELIEEVLHEI